MNYSFISKIVASSLLVGVLTACGGDGGGGDTAPAAVVPAPTTFTVAGTAASGSAFHNATVTMFASDGTRFGGGATDLTGTDGSYTLTLPIAAKPPFVVQAARDDKTLISVVAEAKDTTTNITPVTNLIASRLSTSGDPARLADEIKANPALADAAAVKAKVAEIVALIKPLMDAVGDSTDPLNGKLVADGTGADRVLDSLSISITPSSAGSVNIEVAVKQKQTDGVDPTVVSFTNTTKPSAVIQTVTAADLVPNGTAPLIDDLLKRIAACYAVPLADRVTSGGTAADIAAPACRTLFAGDDPASYKHNGAIVGKTGAWSSIFSGVNLPDTPGIRFDRGSYEFTRANGDLVIAFRSLSSLDAVTNSTAVVTTDSGTGKLKLIGNQYKYNGSVSAYHQLRTFISNSEADYYSTGYVANVNNTVDANGKPIFAKVVVTTPKGGVLTLQPTAGSAYLPLVKSSGVTGTNFLRIRSVYVDAANSAKNPADADTSLFFASTPLTDTEIASIPAQANWKFDYYLAGNATTTPDATQYYKTRARAMTIPELQTRPMANLSDAIIAEAKAMTKSNSSGGLYLPTPVTGAMVLDWVVPTGALPPTSIQVYGGATVAGKSISFNDRLAVKSTDLTGDIACSAASSADTHCSAGNYVAGGFNGAHLLANDANGRDFAHFYAFYTVTIR